MLLPPWANIPWISIDTETTGVDVTSDRIVSIAVVAADLQKVWRVNPGRPIPPEATEIHHITDAMVASARTFDQVIPEVLATISRLLGGTGAIVIKNAPFDVTILNRQLGSDFLEVVGSPCVLDLQVIEKFVFKYRKRIPGQPGPRQLITLARIHGVTWDDERAHTAAYDALITGQVLRKLAERAMWPATKLRQTRYGSQDTAKIHTLADMTAEELHERQITWHSESSESLKQYFQDQALNSTNDEDRHALSTKAQSVTTDWPSKGKL